MTCTTSVYVRSRYRVKADPPRPGAPKNNGHRSDEQSSGAPAAKAASAPYKRNYGWNRSCIDGTEGTRIWTRHGILTHNLIKISSLAA